MFPLGIAQRASGGCSVDGSDEDLVSHDRHDDLVAVALANREIDRAAAGPTDHQHRLVDRPAFGVLAIDGKDDVTRFQPGALGRGPRQRLHDHDVVVLPCHRRTDALEGAGEVVAVDRVGRRVDVRRVRVAEGGEDAVDRALEQQLSVDAVGVDEVLREDVEDLVQDAGVQIGLAFHPRRGCGRVLRRDLGLRLGGDPPEEADGHQQHTDQCQGDGQHDITNRVRAHLGSP